jgi:hypothetical protein
MSELFGVKLFGVATAAFLAVLTVWLLNSLYIVGLFESVLAVAFR